MCNQIHNHDKYISENYLTVPVKRMAKIINRSSCYVSGRLKKLGLVVPVEIIEQRKNDTRIKPGNIPKNKGKKQTEFMSAEQILNSSNTRFKKGNIPHNAVNVKDGDVVVRVSRKGNHYKWIRVSLGSWKMYHVHLWEQTYGPIPEGKIVVFKDKNTMNTIIENLECITREELMLRNSIHKFPEEIKKTIKVVSLITRQINKYEKQNQ